MEGLVRGDVVILSFPFSDLSAAKVRPALVLARTQNDVILSQITSREFFDDYAVSLSRREFVDGCLPTDSWIRLNKLFTADCSIIARKAGRVAEKKFSEAIDSLCLFLRS
ncbi:MAG TPA: type II toxin-antitoxin system PemK/MazF family toxin [Candidatus Nanoarchaeia archaeon]|nr:type II toxin-antitoxin system PemK/MazF family toxin [Candidatus Nanoarchaeia archaeon]